MVFMIADEARNFKPYALPVRVLPNASMTDGRLRELEQELRTAMVNLGMVVVGKPNLLFFFFMLWGASISTGCSKPSVYH